MLTFLIYNSQALHDNQLVISMAEEDYDVILNDKEYKELKENKGRVALLDKQVQQLKSNDESKNIKLAKLEKELEIHREEVSFLLALLASIGSPQDRNAEDIQELEPSGNSASYEVLGESIMFPRKVDPKKSQLRSSDLMKKYSGTVQTIRNIEEKLESQEALIAKLNQMNSEKIDLILTQNTDKLLQVISDRANIKVTSLEQLKDSVSQSKQLKDQVAAIQKKKNFLEKQLKERGAENERLHEQIKRMAADYDSKLKKMQGQLGSAQKGAKEQPASSYGDRPYRIKLLIDQHIKEMEQSLGGVGGLTSQEINVMLESELKSLIEYIPKSMDKKK